MGIILMEVLIMNKTYIITDALTSIGQRLAQELSKNGHNLILSGDDYSGLEELHENISENSDAHHEVFLLEQAKEIDWLRSEEHTSELQSRFDLVCRLLLEKQKMYKSYKYIV